MTAMRPRSSLLRRSHIRRRSSALKWCESHGFGSRARTVNDDPRPTQGCCYILRRDIDSFNKIRLSNEMVLPSLELAVIAQPPCSEVTLSRHPKHEDPHSSQSLPIRQSAASGHAAQRESSDVRGRQVKLHVSHWHFQADCRGRGMVLLSDPSFLFPNP
jgi:hypothetical protein